MGTLRIKQKYRGSGMHVRDTLQYSFGIPLIHGQGRSQRRTGRVRQTNHSNVSLWPTALAGAPVGHDECHIEGKLWTGHLWGEISLRTQINLATAMGIAP